MREEYTRAVLDYYSEHFLAHIISLQHKKVAAESRDDNGSKRGAKNNDRVAAGETGVVRASFECASANRTVVGRLHARALMNGDA